MEDLDLETGDEARAEASPAERRRLAREAAEGKVRSGETGKPKTASKSQAAVKREDGELRGKLDRALDRIAKTLEARGDHELAEVIREDGEQIAQGLMSLTNGVKFLRGPLVFLLNVVEPVLAFGRITRILYHRWQDRAARRQWERDQQPQEGEAVDGVVVNG
jgi:hypothetical protein